jgi:hypothetical protein
MTTISERIVVNAGTSGLPEPGSALVVGAGEVDQNRSWPN